MTEPTSATGRKKAGRKGSPTTIRRAGGLILAIAALAVLFGLAPQAAVARGEHRGGHGG